MIRLGYFEGKTFPKRALQSKVKVLLPPSHEAAAHVVEEGPDNTKRSLSHKVALFDLLNRIVDLLLIKDLDSFDLI